MWSSIARKSPNNRLQRTVMDKVPSQRAAAEPGRAALLLGGHP